MISINKKTIIYEKSIFTPMPDGNYFYRYGY